METEFADESKQDGNISLVFCDSYKLLIRTAVDAIPRKQFGGAVLETFDECQNMPSDSRVGEMFQSSLSCCITRFAPRVFI
jgi:hypothetical protein